ncbi:hypothetical protein DSUL_20242 [Desulfovibrionales bacterium]
MGHSVPNREVSFGKPITLQVNRVFVGGVHQNRKRRSELLTAYQGDESIYKKVFFCLSNCP